MENWKILIIDFILFCSVVFAICVLSYQMGEYAGMSVICDDGELVYDNLEQKVKCYEKGYLESKKKVNQYETQFFNFTGI